MSMIGKTLGHYKIGDQPLGKGGMGEVYRAKDLKLGRDVAIKVLPEEFAKDADRVARFQREAKLLASLNHPNIAAIYGLEEFEGTNFLVLELVEGETLAGQLKRGPIPVEESLKLALQIAEALEAAHEKGVIHRDLKPANIKVTPDGKVKVLDFGLAKAFAGEQADVNSSNSPTLSNAATQQGVILGTAAYMSPEQAKGKTVDKRADVWAFGVVLFEMLTGQQLFKGETVSETLAAVLMREPDFLKLPHNLHPKILEALKRCLEKETKNRYSGINDARVDIQEALDDPGGVLVQPKASSERKSKWSWVLPWVAIAVFLSLIIGGMAVWKYKPTEPHQVMRFYFELPEGQEFSNPSRSMLAVSADGKQFVYATFKGLYLRSLDDLSAKLIPGTEDNPEQPFFSPDGKWIRYFSASDRKLKKIAINGGTPVALCDAAVLNGASWDENGTIVYGQLSNDIMKISADGGTPEPIIENKSGLAIFPQILPDGKSVLYTAPTSESRGKIMVQPLKSGATKTLFTASGAHYLSTGHIVYRAGNTFFAVPFDLRKMEITGGPVPVAEGVGQAATSDSGMLVYLASSTISGRPAVTPVWVNLEGKEQPVSAPPNAYGALSNSSPKISPDGTRVALTYSTGGDEDIWIWDFIRETMTRITFGGGENAWPLWTQDGRRIVYRSFRDGHYSISRKAADGSGEVENLGSVSDFPGPFSWSKDGKSILSWDLTRSPFHTYIGMLLLEGGIVRKPLLKENYDEDHPQISPDGRWIAYSSDESGQNEVYVRPFPEVNKGRWQISMRGGIGPLWAPNGRELFYRGEHSVMAVPVETQQTFKSGKPKALFRDEYFSTYAGPVSIPMWDISPDGKRFLMLKETESTAKPVESRHKINIVINWFEELKQRVPVK